MALLPASSPPPPPPPPQSRLHQTFKDVDFSHHHHSEAWSSPYIKHDNDDNSHPWDREDGPSLALADLLSQREDLVPAAQLDNGNLVRKGTPRRTALVPGCGRGHDVLLLSAFGYDVVGLDSSPQPRAARAADDGDDDDVYAQFAREGWQKGKVKFVAGDFFADDWVAGETFDLIYDYTFLCVLPPETRPRWAKRISELVRPDGRLVCLEFPSGKPLSEAGPPWGLTPEVYEALLSAPGEPVSYDSQGEVVPPTCAKPHPCALHRLSIMKPARTHEAGTDDDGTVRDFISVWSR